METLEEQVKILLVSVNGDLERASEPINLIWHKFGTIIVKIYHKFEGQLLAIFAI